ncbi:cation diffusion facilitator family transporter [Anaeromicropila herbilytica]|uniref:Cation transporter n=1 Tax=Anaeromicropila herbilytica TaxID=2785025 RepID=A0A7R7EN32_9FIRM|nr:cation diffusion facilitator family transporter [Anaeromicropila herbilytica]BCN31651.1 cation transporter [Anaeromicropila herbilytica]
MGKMNRKTRVALISVASNSLLVIMKILAGILSGSISIVSEAMHSGMDLVASLIAFIAVRTSSKPADKEHPYGHGKLENISGLAEGVLIFVAAGMIIYEAGKKIMHPVELEQAFVAIAVMVLSGIVNFFVSRKLHKVATEEESQALEADSLHLKTDVYTSLGVGVGVLLVKLTGIAILDPIVAILVAILIIKEAWHLSKGAFEFLIDVKLSDEEEAEVIKVIERHKDSFIDYHKLKTRKAGSMKHIDFHITVPEQLPVGEAHKIIGNIKKDMNENLLNTRVSIHIDPYVTQQGKEER